jgi:hypothetical protein
MKKTTESHIDAREQIEGSLAQGNSRQTIHNANVDSS